MTRQALWRVIAPETDVTEVPGGMVIRCAHENLGFALCFVPWPRYDWADEGARSPEDVMRRWIEERVKG